MKRIRGLADQWGSKRPDSTWQRFEAAGYRASLLRSMAEAIIGEGVDSVDLFVGELKESESSLKHVQELLKDPAAQLQFFHLLGNQRKSQVTKHLEFMRLFPSS